MTDVKSCQKSARDDACAPDVDKQKISLFSARIFTMTHLDPSLVPATTLHCELVDFKLHQRCLAVVLLPVVPFSNALTCSCDNSLYWELEPPWSRREPRLLGSRIGCHAPASVTPQGLPKSPSWNKNTHCMWLFRQSAKCSYKKRTFLSF